MLALDVANLQEQTNIVVYMFWFIVLMSSLFYVNVILPFGLFYTETNEEKEFVRNILNFFSCAKKTFLILFTCRNGGFVWQ